MKNMLVGFTNLDHLWKGGMLKKLKSQLQTEIDTSFLYLKLSEKYDDALAKNILKKMSQIEERHAQHVLSKIHALKPNYLRPGPSIRAKLQVSLGKIFGYGFILSQLATLEAQISKTVIQKKRAEGEHITGLENVHFNIIQNISRKKSMTVGGPLLSTFEGKHKTIGGNELRAAVLGANDGLVSNMSLVMGVAGATGGHNEILIAGIAGLLAGAISMALGEWVSVQSSRELYQRQIDIEAEELESSPQEEMNELSLLYQAKGLAEEAANKLALEVISNKETALESLVREELGIDMDELGGSAYKAAFTSFFLFSFGAIIPLFPFFFLTGGQAVKLSVVASTIGLFAIGAAITLFTGRSVLWSGLRQMLFGLTAAGVTYLIGLLIGITLLT